MLGLRIEAGMSEGRSMNAQAVQKLTDQISKDGDRDVTRIIRKLSQLDEQQPYIRFSLDFTDIILPVGYNHDGRAIVPLKPIAARFSLDWASQFKKVNKPSLSYRLGITLCTLLMDQQRREVVCIRADRVATYLSTVNTRSVRSAGNTVGADWLEIKQAMWDSLMDEGIKTIYTTG